MRPLVLQTEARISLPSSNSLLRRSFLIETPQGLTDDGSGLHHVEELRREAHCEEVGIVSAILWRKSSGQGLMAQQYLQQERHLLVAGAESGGLSGFW
jgi:hypothetical protein